MLLPPLLAICALSLPGRARAQIETTRHDESDHGQSAPASMGCGEGAYGCFLDRDGRYRLFEEAYEILHAVPERHYGVAALEELLFVGVGAAWYFIALEDNKLDWDIESVRQRFSRESVRYDSNTFAMNFVLHPLSGAAYYGFPRANGLSVPASFVYGTVASMLWEFGLEFNERLSINDMISTSVGGMALGEFFSRLARYLNSAPGGGNAWHRAFGYTLGVTQAFHDRALDGRRGSPEGTVTDALGYDAALAHRFRVDHGFGLARTDDVSRFGRHELRIVADLVAIPGYMRPGAFRRFYGDANFTRFVLRGLGGPRGSGVEMHADAVLLGFVAQDLRQGARGLHGYSLSLGSSVAYTYRRDAHAELVDKLGITHLPGVALDLVLALGPVSLRARGRLHGDFAAVRSLAFDAWEEANPGVRTKTVLERESYYYGWGYSARAELELESAYVDLGVHVAHARYASHEGLDRHQEEIDESGVDVPAWDRVLDAEAFVRLRPMPSVPFHVELGVARRARASRVGSFAEDARFDRLMLRAGSTF